MTKDKKLYIVVAIAIPIVIAMVLLAWLGNNKLLALFPYGSIASIWVILAV